MLSTCRALTNVVVDCPNRVDCSQNDLLRDATVTPDEMREMSTREVMLQTGRISLEDLERWEEEQRRVRKRTADGANGAGGDGEEEEGEETRDAKVRETESLSSVGQRWLANRKWMQTAMALRDVLLT